MEELKITKTKQTPEIQFNSKTGVFEIGGRSIPENTFEFYNPVIEWIEKYVENPADKTLVKVYLEYFNTSSSKFILEIFKKLRPIKDIKSKEILVEWYYDEDDEEMMETGEDYEDVTELPFDLKMIEEDE